MKLLDDYFSLRDQIFEYFGYVEDWRAFPLDDARNCYWRIIDDSGMIIYAESEKTLGSQDDGYEDDIYTYVHLDKWIYEAEKFTMILCDPHSDGNIFLRIFDNSKRR